MADLELRLKHGKGETDDWTKIEDKARRKTIQNRLAQRKRRTKQLKEKPRQHSALPVRPADEQPTVQGEPSEPSNATPPLFTSPPSAQTLDAPEGTPPTSGSSAPPSAIIIQRSASPPLQHDRSTLIADYFATPGLTEHHFIVLSQYAFLRAFFHNAKSLRLGPHLFADDNAVSPYTVFNPYPITTMGGHSNNLAPTPIQLSMFHHPYIDVIASPKLRDNILLAGLDDAAEDDLCQSLHDGGFTVWGSQPGNAMGWEVSQKFLTKWEWIVDEETMRWSNFWRFERGELPLQTVAGGGEVLGEIV